jgi:hypothetical protein
VHVRSLFETYEQTVRPAACTAPPGSLGTRASAPIGSSERQCQAENAQNIIERDASACMRRHPASALAPVLKHHNDGNSLCNRGFSSRKR